MYQILMFLTSVSIFVLIIGLVKPSLVRMPSRKKVGIVFGISTFALALISSPFAPPEQPSAPVSAASSATTTAATASSAAAQADVPLTPAQQRQNAAVTPAPSEPATLTDSAYMEQFEGTVMLYIQALGSDVMDGSAAIADSNVAQTSAKQSSDISAALTDFQQGQSDLAQAQAALQEMQSNAPSDMATIQRSAGEYLTSEALVLSLFIGHVNSDTLSMSDTSDVYTQMSRSNLYQGQMNAAIQQWETSNL